MNILQGVNLGTCSPDKATVSLSHLDVVVLRTFGSLLGIVQSGVSGKPLVLNFTWLSSFLLPRRTPEVCFVDFLRNRTKFVMVL